jgi:hypothetical protein
MHRRQQIRRSLIGVGLLGLVAGGSFLAAPVVRHYRAAFALAATGFTVDWRPDPESQTGGGYTAVHGSQHSFLAHSMDDELKILSNLQNLEELNLAECNVSEAGLAPLRDLKGLKELNLSRTDHYRYGGFPGGFSDGCLIPIQGLVNLRRLSLAGNPITDAGLARLEKLTNLDDLDLAATEITDAGLEHLQSLRKLTALNLGGTRVTPEGVKRFQAAIPGCEINQELDAEIERTLRLMRSNRP